MSVVNPTTLKVVELREELARRHLPTTGNKEALIQRLQGALQPEEMRLDFPTGSSQASKDGPVDGEDVVMKEDCLSPSSGVGVEAEEATPPQRGQAESNGPVEASPAASERRSRGREAERRRIAPYQLGGGIGGVGRLLRTALRDSAASRQVDGAKPQEDRLASYASSPEGKAAPSELLAIRNFVRPLRVPQVQEMLERYGMVRSFWMDQLKSRCYVLYEKVNSAKAALEGVWKTQFPLGTGTGLLPTFIPSSRWDDLLREEEDAAKLGSRLSPLVEDGVYRLMGPEETRALERKRRAMENRLNMEERAKKAALAGIAKITAKIQAMEGSIEEDPKEDALAATTLDEHYIMTKADPPIYYRPWTAQEVVERRARSGMTIEALPVQPVSEGENGQAAPMVVEKSADAE